jgi:hypothetical protein
MSRIVVVIRDSLASFTLEDRTWYFTHIKVIEHENMDLMN